MISSTLRFLLAIDYPLSPAPLYEFITGPVFGGQVRVSGTLTFVDSSRRIINVTSQSGAVLVLSVTPAAVVVVDEAVKALDDLGNRIGSKVTAIYNMANNIATSVEVSR